MSDPDPVAPCKVLAVQLASCPGSRPGAAQPHVCTVTRDRGAAAAGFEPGRGSSLPLRVSKVWMQGDVLTVAASDGGSARITDGTGEFTVHGLASVPKGSPCMAPGEYVLVYGAVVSCGPNIAIKAIKVMGLTGNPAHRAMWRAEVADLQQFLP